MVSPPFEDAFLQDNRQRETQGVDAGRVLLTRSGVRTMDPFRRITFGRAKSQESQFSQQHLPSIPCHLAPKAGNYDKEHRQPDLPIEEKPLMGKAPRQWSLSMCRSGFGPTGNIGTMSA